MKTYRKILNLLPAVALGLVLTACVNKDFNSPDQGGPAGGSDIPNDFGWTNVNTSRVTVNVDDEYNGQYYYTVEIFTGNPATDPATRLLSGGKTDGKTLYKAQITIPGTSSSIYIRQTDPYGKKRVFAFPLSGESMTCDLAASTQNGSKAQDVRRDGDTRFAMPEIDYTVPSAAVSIEGTEAIRTGKVYVVESGSELTVSNVPGEGNFALYVKGEVIVKNSLTLQQGVAVYVLDGGKLTGANKKKYTISGTGWDSKAARIAVAEGGRVGEADEDQLQLSFNGKSMLVNEGSVNLDDFKMTNEVCLYNSGEFKAKTVSMTDLTNKIVNTRDFSVENSLTLTNGVVNNACKFVIGKDNADNGQCTINGGTINLGSGSILQCDHFQQVGGLKLQMDGLSMLVAKTMNFTAQQNILTGALDEYALLKAEKITIQGSYERSVLYGGKIEIATSNHAKKGYVLQAPAVFAEGEPSVEIPADYCNGNTGNHNPGETDKPDTDPDYEEIETLPYTYLFEDSWPMFGDYDMNDLVMDIQVANIKSGSMTTGFRYKATVRAAGATKLLGAAFQLDNVDAGNVKEADPGQKKAVIRLFDDVHALFQVDRKEMVNTYTITKKPIVIEKTIQFNTPINEVIDAKSMNVFIVWGGLSDSKWNEVHLPHYKGTDKAAVSATSVDYVYKAAKGEPTDDDNMMWALMIPAAERFAYPKETVSIDKAYPKFREWAKSGGKNEEMKDWYLHPAKDQVIALGEE